MAPKLLAEFSLPLSLETFLKLFWVDRQWCETFMREKLENLEIDIADWENGATNEVRVRQIKSYHPSKISFPGLPSYAESLKTQTYEITSTDASKSTAVITETNTIRGIPYADYFNVKIKWEVVCTRSEGQVGSTTPGKSSSKSQTHSNGGGSSSSGNSHGLPDPSPLKATSPATSPGKVESGDEVGEPGVQCSITIWLDFDFFKYTWLQGTIESNTQAELLGVYELWVASAQEYLKNRSESLLELQLAIDVADVAVDVDAGRARAISQSNPASRSQPSSVGVPTDEEDNEFYDCSEGGGDADAEFREYPLARSLSRARRDHSSSELQSLGQGGSTGSLGGGGGSTRRSTIEIHNAASLRNFYSADSPRSTRDVVVTVVETIFVVAEASFWRIHTIYRTDVKVLFSVTPDAIVQRVINTVRPGCHSAALAQPDFYGPLLAVFLMPQILLLSMDVSQYGCNQTSMLGNATVVTLSLWVGLSILYRLLSFVIAPGIYFKHCLCITGYSFYAWSLALLCSYPVEKYKAILQLPVALPLVIFGIPAALAQGYVFWEHTPYASAGMQQALYPTSLQHFAQHHSRWLQKLLWAVPKVAALIVVAGTHYQLLWYLARVFLPGRKHLCNLSALVDRSQAADILSQKELRHFAFMLLRTASEGRP